MLQKILLIEEDSGFRTTIRNRLIKQGYQVEQSAAVKEGLNQASAGQFDLVILDCALLENNGSDVAGTLEALGRSTPLLVLTGRGDPFAMAHGLKLDVRHSLAKPFDMQQLLARVEALMRRPVADSGAPTPPYVLGNVEVNPECTAAYRDGKLVRLSAREQKLLRCLLTNRGHTLSRELLLQNSWGPRPVLDTRIVDLYILRLRRKLEENPRQPRWLLTIHGEGYKICP